MQVTSTQSFTQLPANRPAAQPAEQASAQAPITPSKDGVSFGRGALSVLGGTGAALLGSGAASAAITLIAEKGIPKDFGGYIAVGTAVGGAAGLAGALTSAV
ncbi:MAG: hypothetical protein CVV27_07215, partial [Candidatus Melainabacteria bacterium HGW-Melainabacteria-1]